MPTRTPYCSALHKIRSTFDVADPASPAQPRQPGPAIAPSWSSPIQYSRFVVGGWGIGRPGVGQGTSGLSSNIDRRCVWRCHRAVVTTTLRSRVPELSRLSQKPSPVNLNRDHCLHVFKHTRSLNPNPWLGLRKLQRPSLALRLPMRTASARPRLLNPCPALAG